MAKILADIEKKADIADEAAQAQQKRNWKPLLIVPVIVAAAAGSIVFIKRQASK